MITLITGTPGAGKTLYAVHSILQGEAQKGRKVFVDGIPDLVVPHEPSQDPLDWPEWAPQGALICVDECQRIWPKAPSGSKAPRSIVELETHRHRGLDFVLITQNPALVHHNLRSLVGRHIHLRNTALGVYLYEWPECADSPATAWKTAPVKIKWSHPKKSFGLYKSASLHVKTKHRLPPAVYIVGASVLALITGGYYITQSVAAKIQPQAPTIATAPGPIQEYQARQDNFIPDLEFQHPIISFTPRFPDVPHSAPAYSGLVQVVAAPRITICVASQEKCTCYSQQITPLNISDDLCRRHAAGLEFDPYTPDVAVTPPGQPSLQASRATETHSPEKVDLPPAPGQPAVAM